MAQQPDQGVVVRLGVPRFSAEGTTAAVGPWITVCRGLLGNLAPAERFGRMVAALEGNALARMMLAMQSPAAEDRPPANVESDEQITVFFTRLFVGPEETTMERNARFRAVRFTQRGSASANEAMEDYILKFTRVMTARTEAITMMS